MKIRTFVEEAIDLLDWPSGSILGLHTLLMIGMSAYLSVMKVRHPDLTYEMPSTVVDVYKFVLLNFSVVKGAKVGATLFGKFVKTDVPKEESK